MNEGYSICFNEWALDKDIKNELGLLLIISSLCAKEGYCFASNSYLAKLFEVDEVSISRKLKRLEEKKYISIEYIKKQGYIVQRNIRLTRIVDSTLNKNVNRTLNKIANGTLNKNVKDNNINNNIIRIKDFENNKIEEDLASLYEN